MESMAENSSSKRHPSQQRGRTTSEPRGMVLEISAAQAAAPLTASGLSHRYCRRRGFALDAVDLRVEHAGITGLVGPNGAGKSTLIKIWAGLERPSGGHARVAGFDPWRERKSAAACLGYVPQVPALYRSLTVDQHLSLAAAERERFDASRSREYLLHLRVPLHAKGAELSGGQRAQVSLALALGTRAQVLLLDEPLASLDPLARREFLQVLTDAVSEMGSVALLSSHVISDIEEACERLIVLGEGRVLVEGLINELLSLHWVASPGAVPDADTVPVATFVGRDRRQHELWRAGAPTVQARSDRLPATLEDVVVGYLSLGRGEE